VDAFEKVIRPEKRPPRKGPGGGGFCWLKEGKRVMTGRKSVEVTK